MCTLEEEKLRAWTPPRSTTRSLARRISDAGRYPDSQQKHLASCQACKVKRRIRRKDRHEAAQCAIDKGFELLHHTHCYTRMEDLFTQSPNQPPPKQPESIGLSPISRL